MGNFAGNLNLGKRFLPPGRSPNQNVINKQFSENYYPLHEYLGIIHCRGTNKKKKKKEKKRNSLKQRNSLNIKTLTFLLSY